jgi:predicted nucleotidyltransferase
VSEDLAARRAAARVPGERAARTREVVVAALAACEAALGAWEAGSAAFGRADESSDFDVCVICADGAAAEVVDALERALFDVTDEVDVWRAGRTSFGIQRFWHPRGDGVPMLSQVDTAVMEHVGEAELWRELLTVERHGRALELHDPDGVLRDARACAVFDADAHRARIASELARFRARRTLFGGVPGKERGRGRTLDAHGFHGSMVVTPLLALVGMRYRPLRFDFGFRYLHDELPSAVVERLVPIVVPGGPDALPAATAAGLAWIDELLAELDPATMPIEEHAAQMRATFA